MRVNAFTKHAFSNSQNKTNLLTLSILKGRYLRDKWSNLSRLEKVKAPQKGLEKRPGKDFLCKTCILDTNLKYIHSRTSQDMDGAHHTDFANFYTIWGSTTKISGLLQLGKKWILTKFEGCGSKIGPARPIWSFRHFWWEIFFFGRLKPSDSRCSKNEYLVKNV